MPKVRLKNISVYYDIRGEGFPLLLIPGLDADHASWEDVYPKLSKHFRVILFDNRSCGRSDYPDTKYSISDMAGDVAGLLDHLKIERSHIMGHSMGGYVAQELAISRPDRVEKLVLEATACVSSKRNNELVTGFLKQYEEDRDKEALMRLWMPWLFSPALLKHKEYMETYIKDAAAYPYFQSPEGLRRQIEAAIGFDSSGRLKEIKAKTLVIAGEDDVLIYPAESRKMAEGINGSKYEEIKGAGHCVHAEKPDAFISTVISFLR